LNSCDIDIKSVIYNNDIGKSIQSKEIKLDTENETMTVTFLQNLPIGKFGVLHIVFQSEINDKLKGLYRSKYTR
jgi:hypothetical protein